MKTALTTLLIAFLGCSVLCDKAQALPQISGDIGFFGPASPSGASPGFPITITFPNSWQVLSGTGDYAVIPFGTSPVSFKSFAFTGDGAGATLVASIPAEWSFSFNGIDYSFDLGSLTNGHTDANGLAGAMSFTGVGTVHATGFEDTPASWGLQGTGANVNFILSSSTTSAIPEGGVMSLLGFGFALLAGKGLLGRKRI